jgi:NCS1 family nucleobase:cation symporter-1
MGVTSRGTTSTESGLPLRHSERNWGPLALFGNSASAAVATWCFIIGGYLSYYLPAGIGTLVMIAGMLSGMFFVILAAVPVATRYGVEAVRSTRPQLGVRGSGFSLALLVTFTVGWNTILIIFLGRAAAQVLIGLNVLPEGARGVTETVTALIGCLVVWAALRGGPQTLKNVGPVIATSVIVLSLVILAMLVDKLGWDGIFNAPAVAPYEDKLLNYTTGIELLVATALSWWPYVGGMTRLMPNTRKALWPTILGLGLAVSVVCLIGLYAGVAVPESGGDPTAYLVDIGGVGFATVALLFIVLANVGTAMVGLYAGALAIKQVPALDRRLTWNGATGITMIPVAVVVLLFATPFYDHFPTFLAFSGVVFGPLCGVQIADYYLVRRQHLDLRALFEDVPGGKYWYWKGFNLVGLASVAIGVGTYLYLLDPVTFESKPIFKYITASIPAALIAGLVFLVLTKLLTKQAKTEPARAGVTERL